MVWLHYLQPYLFYCPVAKVPLKLMEKQPSKVSIKAEMTRASEADLTGRSSDCAVNVW